MLSSQPGSTSRPRELSAQLGDAFFSFILFKKKKQPRSKPFMSIFKTQPHWQYAFQLFPPSTQPATAQPIINGSYRQRKGFRIIGSCCLISRRRLRTRLSSFLYRRHQSPDSNLLFITAVLPALQLAGLFPRFSACQRHYYTPNVAVRASLAGPGWDGWRWVG